MYDAPVTAVECLVKKLNEHLLLLLLLFLLGGVDKYGALGHGKVQQQKTPLGIKMLDEILVQKVICNKNCTIVLEDFWATQLLRYAVMVVPIYNECVKFCLPNLYLRVMAGVKGIVSEDVHQLRSYTYHSPIEQVLPSLHLAYQCHKNRTNCFKL